MHRLLAGGERSSRRTCLPRWIVAPVALMSLTLACGSSAGPGDAIADIRSRSENSSVERPWDSVSGLVDFITEQHEAGTEYGIVVSGTISSVEKGAGFAWEITADGERRIQLPYGDEEAMINTVHLTIVVDELLAPPREKRETAFTVGLAFDPEIPFEAVVADMTGLGEVVVFMEGSPVFDYQPGLFGIIGDGQMIGDVKSDGRVVFPMLGDGELPDSNAVTLETLTATPN